MSYLTYFAYGSNMLTERLRRRVPSTAPLGAARLDDWRLRFHKRGADGSAKCNIVEAGGGTVHGVLFEIEADERRLLDRAEGLGRGYDLAEVSVETAAGPAEAFCYVASPDHVDGALSPFEWYRDFVLYGGLEHELPTPYLGRIRGIDALADPRPVRAEKNRRVLRASEHAASELAPA